MIQVVYSILAYYGMEYKMSIDLISYMSKTIFTKEHKYTVDQLKRARLETGLGQEDVARLINKSQSYISKIESGQRRIDIVQLKQLARAYSKDISYFIKE